MVPNTKKTKHLIIGTVQKLLYSGNPSFDLSLCGTPIEDAKDEKLLGVKIDKHLNWDNDIDFLIDKLNSRICLLKRAKACHNYRQRNLLYNAIISPMLMISIAIIRGRQQIITYSYHLFRTNSSKIHKIPYKKRVDARWIRPLFGRKYIVVIA